MLSCLRFIISFAGFQVSLNDQFSDNCGFFNIGGNSFICTVKLYNISEFGCICTVFTTSYFSSNITLNINRQMAILFFVYCLYLHVYKFQLSPNFYAQVIPVSNANYGRHPHVCDGLPQFAGDIRIMEKACHSLQEILALWRKLATVCRRCSQYGETLPQNRTGIRRYAELCHSFVGEIPHCCRILSRGYPKLIIPATSQQQVFSQLYSKNEYFPK